uniref:Foie-gras_1 domain-containing protein n=1 Tax=Mesocestoides corti TaxID=53468 RepID=A0A5K3FF64_MESCO
MYLLTPMKPVRRSKFLSYRRMERTLKSSTWVNIASTGKDCGPRWVKTQVSPKPRSPLSLSTCRRVPSQPSPSASISASRLSVFFILRLPSHMHLRIKLLSHRNSTLRWNRQKVLYFVAYS